MRKKEKSKFRVCPGWVAYRVTEVYVCDGKIYGLDNKGMTVCFGVKPTVSEGDPCRKKDRAI